jgi:cytochrome oxidase assembly protein ShyY1
MNRYPLWKYLLLVVVLVLGSLGVWQLDRSGQAQERVTAQTTRLEAEPAPADDILAGLSLDDTEALAELEFRRVVASGTWRPADEVLQRGRSHAGQTGFHVLTPLDLADGSTVIVRRGWVPFDNDLRPPVTDAAPPAGPVVVEGYLERSIPQPTGLVAQRDPADGELDIVFNADLSRLGVQFGGEVLPMLVHLDQQVPTPVSALPIPAPRPELDAGPHLNYAIQWFLFALIGSGMYALWLRRRLQGDERAVSHAPVSRS